MGATPPPAARRALTWPGVARPILSPKPADVRVPSGRGRIQGMRSRRASTLAALTGPSRSVRPPLALLSPSKLETTGDPGGARIATLAPDLARPAWTPATETAERGRTSR